MTQPLFRGFRTRAETEAAEKQVLSGRAKLGEAEQQLFLDTASAYLGVLRDEAVLELERNHEAILEDKLKETHVRAQMGELTKPMCARRNRASLARMSPVFRRRARSRRIALPSRAWSAMRRNDCSPLPSFWIRPELLADIFHSAETQNPDVISAQYAVEEADGGN